VSEREVLHQVLDDLKREAGLRYADLRFVEEQTERVRVRNGRLDACDTARERGVGVRVLIDQAWGFASAPGLDVDRVRRAARRAVEVARASAKLVTERVSLAHVTGSPARGRYATRLYRDPFSVPLDEKVADLAAPTERMLKGASVVRTAEAHMRWTRQRKILVTSEGTDIEQEFTYGGAGMHCIAVSSDGHTQRRSYPTFMDGDPGQGGYERVTLMRMTDAAEIVRDEAVALLKAEPLPAGKRVVILEGSQLALQVHESCGHPAELDRALGTEVSLAGGSFLRPAMLGRFTYGSSKVNLTAEALTPGGLGTFGWDDEGTPATRTPIVKEGLFVGYLSSRETAARIGTRPSGAMRASGYARPPLIRMVNVNLEPDPKGGTLEELIADTDDGLLIATNKSWSIDDLRLNFQFGCEVAWEIRKGKLGRMFRDPVYTGITPRFWRGCDAVCGNTAWKLWGILNCGKGEPGQVMHVSHGAAPARFIDVEVGHG
jgi:TldD protein